MPRIYRLDQNGHPVQIDDQDEIHHITPDRIDVVNEVPHGHYIVLANPHYGSPDKAFAMIAKGDVIQPTSTVEVVKWGMVGQTNLNNADNNKVQIGGVVAGAIDGCTADNDDITLPMGQYEITFFMAQSGTIQRSNIGWRLEINGNEYQSYYGGNYNRAGSGHNESNDCITDYFELSTQGTVTLRGYQMAASGSVTLENTSYIIIKKIG